MPSLSLTAFICFICTAFPVCSFATPPSMQYNPKMVAVRSRERSKVGAEFDDAAQPHRRNSNPRYSRKRAAQMVDR